MIFTAQLVNPITQWNIMSLILFIQFLFLIIVCALYMISIVCPTVHKQAKQAP